MIERILPASVVAVEAFGDVADPHLYPEEAALVANAVAKRRNEFATVRYCARQALARLGVPPAPLLPGPRGAPRWPAGVVGSMTHCDGYRAAAVVGAGTLAALGVDAEPHLPLPDGVLRLVAGEQERDRLASLAGSHPGTCWDRVLFSAKESVYKAWFPLTGRWLDFAEADVVLEPGAGAFEARLLVPGPELAGRTLTGFAGRFLVDGGLILTTVAVPADDLPETRSLPD